MSEIKAYKSIFLEKMDKVAHVLLTTRVSDYYTFELESEMSCCVVGLSQVPRLT